MDITALTRPSKKLLTLYFVRSFVGLVFAPIVFIPLYFRWHSLTYRFDDDGVHASWGILFRREVSLTYARIQDIHLKRGLVERWLGLGSVQIQTASGGGGSDLVIEGVTEFNDVRDFLYAKMRGAHPKPKDASARVDDAAIKLLVEIRDELAAVREKIGAPRA